VEQPQVAHLERRLHLRVESVDVNVVGPCDHQIIDIHAHDKAPITFASQVDGVLGGAPLEAKLEQ
jgi:hypothetical protein